MLTNQLKWVIYCYVFYMQHLPGDWRDYLNAAHAWRYYLNAASAWRDYLNAASAWRDYINVYKCGACLKRLSKCITCMERLSKFSTCLWRLSKCSACLLQDYLKLSQCSLVKYCLAMWKVERTDDVFSYIVYCTV